MRPAHALGVACAAVVVACATGSPPQEFVAFAGWEAAATRLRSTFLESRRNPGNWEVSVEECQATIESVGFGLPQRTTTVFLPLGAIRTIQVLEREREIRIWTSRDAVVQTVEVTTASERSPSWTRQSSFLRGRDYLSIYSIDVPYNRRDLLLPLEAALRHAAGVCGASVRQ